MIVFINHKCGHTSAIYVSGKLSERADKRKDEESKDCWDCSEKQVVKQQAFKFQSVKEHN